ncbi:class I SAM-dependent methyltransferase [Alishewanella tabrizica]|uniref:Methyltransferase type 11 domain-containing protein n=1 Tax=Alishewanella tabrizica TaxID=671278 RepID=A0ABQ2WFJ6_9ALTE|nr:class I SAM-dependent methyltransferase [Alishewanella tabrizica]GGW51173.1 hypothetical protein GCM10008111_03910 [Alishewanella tabrizica]
MEHWDHYWLNRKTVTSFANSGYDTGYAGQLAQFWQDTFAGLAGSAVMLDLGCGNGALSLLALRSGKASTILAVDFAAIDPCQLFADDHVLLTELKQISFHPSCKMEALPFAEHHVDLAISQFGFEYSDITQSLPELFRVLQPNGKAVLLCHDAASEISLLCKAGITVLNELLKKGSLIDQLIDYAVRFAKTDAVQLDARREYNKKLIMAFQQYRMGLNDMQASFFNDIIGPFVSLMSNQSELNVCDFEHLKKQLGFELTRIADQVQAAYSIQDIRRFNDHAVKAGFNADIHPFTLNNLPFAWAITLKRT